MQPIWVLVNCNTSEEAEKIGRVVLEMRLGSCFDIFPRTLSQYFWPPKSGKMESAKGALLIVESFQSKYKQLLLLVKKLHTDKMPFIGYIRIEGVEETFCSWMKDEIR